MTKPSVSAVLLSMGNRPAELAEALETLKQQTGVELETILVGNGWEPVDVPDWVKTIHLPNNVGCPGGRNVGAAAASGEFIFFYDDDALLPEADVLARMVAVFGTDDRIGVVQPRGLDPNGKPAPRRWVPRLNVKDGGVPGEAAVFWEALSMFRRSAFEEVGGWPGSFFFAHEGVDIAMRLLDRGWTIRYEPSIVVNHPATAASRHEIYYRTNARNRVWVARRNLPAPLVPVYLGTWAGATIVRVRNLTGLRAWFSGFAEGWRTDPGPRKPISWKTALRMTRLGRPPVF